mmetsp:Transcript_20288/g.56522  ORF Transcript_20288/g.56522 Transcript_20288/m.56522 type:complete len:206 (-) Transcript_20288:113-730(-)
MDVLPVRQQVQRRLGVRIAPHARQAASTNQQWRHAQQGHPVMPSMQGPSVPERAGRLLLLAFQIRRTEPEDSTLDEIADRSRQEGRRHRGWCWFQHSDGDANADRILHHRSWRDADPHQPDRRRNPAQHQSRGHCRRMGGPGRHCGRVRQRSLRGGCSWTGRHRAWGSFAGDPILRPLRVGYLPAEPPLNLSLCDSSTSSSYDNI